MGAAAMMRFVFGLVAFLFVLSTPARADDPPPGWEFRGAHMDESPAAGQRPCRAYRHSDAVNTRLMRNREGKMVLIASWPTWNHSQYPLSATLSVDGASPVDVTGYGVGPLFMVLIESEALHSRLISAHRLDWHLPWGDFAADVEGIGQAFDMLDVCPE